MLTRLFRKKRTTQANEIIRRAIEEHDAFELEHKAHLASAYQGLGELKIGVVDLGEGKTLRREAGEYDRDQKIERVAQLVRDAYGKKKPPKNLRELIGKCL